MLSCWVDFFDGETVVNNGLLVVYFEAWDYVFDQDLLELEN